MPVTSHKRESRQERRAARKVERHNRRNAYRHPELVVRESQQNDLEARLEHEANKIIFGPLTPRNPRQALLIDTLKRRRITIADGPAGTGKTFITTSLACEMLEAGEIQRLVIARPMVGCDEEMGFLPGDEYEKYAPWLGPFLDVLEGKLGARKVQSYMAYKKIVARPLMMMRGATFRDAFVILDEAQNTTVGQMKMFLTRLGAGSRLVLAGDIEQSDLPQGKPNGLADFIELSRDSKVVGRVTFGLEDQERDELVAEVLRLYASRYKNTD